MNKTPDSAATRTERSEDFSATDPFVGMRFDYIAPFDEHRNCQVTWVGSPGVRFMDGEGFRRFPTRRHFAEHARPRADRTAA